MKYISNPSDIDKIDLIKITTNGGDYTTEAIGSDCQIFMQQDPLDSKENSLQVVGANVGGIIGRVSKATTEQKTITISKVENNAYVYSYTGVKNARLMILQVVQCVL